MLRLLKYGWLLRVEDVLDHGRNPAAVFVIDMEVQKITGDAMVGLIEQANPDQVLLRRTVAVAKHAEGYG